jgi:Ca-activated chloride channel family protein
VILRTAALLAFSATAALLPGSVQQPTFSTRVEAVRVDVLVTDGGRPVRDLQPTDFDVFDNGVPQRVDLATFEQLPLNVVLALDVSHSVAGAPLDHLRAAGAVVLDGLKTSDRVALLTFSHVVTMRRDLSPDIANVRRAFDQVLASGDTSVIDGSYAGLVMGESDVGRSLLIVFSDGLDTSSWLDAGAVLESARRSDVVVYCVSASLATKNTFLRDLSAITGGRLFEIESTRTLDAFFLTILDEFRQRYLLSYTPRGVSRDGWHRLEVRVKRRDVAVRARPGYLAGSS